MVTGTMIFELSNGVVLVGEASGQRLWEAEIRLVRAVQVTHTGGHTLGTLALEGPKLGTTTSVEPVGVLLNSVQVVRILPVNPDGQGPWREILEEAGRRQVRPSRPSGAAGDLQYVGESGAWSPAAEPQA